MMAVAMERVEEGGFREEKTEAEQHKINADLYRYFYTEIERAAKTSTLAHTQFLIAI
jgi:hypothetical protein